MRQALNLKSGMKVLASIIIVNKRTNKPPTPIFYEDTVRFVDQNGEIF